MCSELIFSYIWWTNHSLKHLSIFASRGWVNPGQVTSVLQSWGKETTNQSHSHSHLTAILESPLNLACLWKPENRWRPRNEENIQTPHRRTCHQIQTSCHPPKHVTDISHHAPVWVIRFISSVELNILSSMSPEFLLKPQLRSIHFWMTQAIKGRTLQEFSYSGHIYIHILYVTRRYLERRGEGG